MERLKKIKLPKETVEAENKQENALIVPEETRKEPRFPKLAAFAEKIHIKPFPWKSINVRGAVAALCLVVIAVAGYVNVRYGIWANRAALEPENEPDSTVAQSGDFFTTAVLDRERARGEALEVLMNITEDDTADEESKSRAFTQMERIADETGWEIDIENLVKSKGFSECVAVINEDSANIVVASDGLTPAEIAQIKEIVYLESKIVPKDVKIIEKKAG
ncbi:MAG: SpoIIIAH-like family protein [Clostridia bacterium]|nr:SpoIIIAH-like family protein [Clostridia bacterium]